MQKAPDPWDQKTTIHPNIMPSQNAPMTSPMPPGFNPMMHPGRSQSPTFMQNQQMPHNNSWQQQPHVGAMQQQVPYVPPQQQQSMAWTYIDASGVVQGPFNERKLVEWMQNGHFFPGTLAKRSHDKMYRSLVHHGFDVKQLDKETCSAMEVWRYEDWYYMDAMDFKQGPFKISKLVAWKDRYFDERTQVCCGINGSFVALKDTVIGQMLGEPLALSSVPTDISTVVTTDNNGNTTNNNTNNITTINTTTTTNNSTNNNNTSSNNNNTSNNNNVGNAATTTSPSHDISRQQPSLLHQQQPSSSNQQMEEIRDLQEELRSMKMALQGSQQSERNAVEEQRTAQKLYTALENDHRRIMAELRETSKKLQDKEEVEDQLRNTLKEQQKTISHLKIYERTVNLYLKPAMELVEKGEKSHKEINVGNRSFGGGPSGSSGLLGSSSMVGTGGISTGSGNRSVISSNSSIDSKNSDSNRNIGSNPTQPGVNIAGKSKNNKNAGKRKPSRKKKPKEKKEVKSAKNAKE